MSASTNITSEGNETETNAAGTNSTRVHLQPYVFFYGRCEEALEFYKRVLGGTYEFQRMEDSPMAEHVSPTFRRKIMHAAFTAPGIAFMASDGREDKTIDPDAGNISLSLTIGDDAEGERVFAALSEGGSINMPLDDAPWGGRFGIVADRFGNEWMFAIR